jgi:DnaK suppressor protein
LEVAIKMSNFKEARNKLSKEREHVRLELEDLKVDIKPDDERREGSPFGEREEEATEVMELEKRVAIEKQLLDSLSKIDRAIEKCDAGTYGTCDLCGRAIEVARLEALPSACLCLSCKANQDKSRNKLAR